MDLLGLLITFAGVAGAVLVLVVIAAMAALGRATPPRVSAAKWWLAACLADVAFGCVLMFAPYIEADFSRKSDLAALDANSKPLIAAIRTYEVNEGHPPRKLSQLVPKYLSAIPRTGLVQWPEYEYHYEGEHEWGLCVAIPSFPFDLFGNRCFLFAPQPESGATLRAGDWVYLPGNGAN